MCFYFTLEFRIYLELYIVSVAVKTCLCWICYEYVQIQIETRKIVVTFSRQRRIWSFCDVVLQRTAKKCTMNYNARAQLLFCSLNFLFCVVLVAVAVVFCVRSLTGRLEQDWSENGMRQWPAKQFSLIWNFERIKRNDRIAAFQQRTKKQSTVPCLITIP